MTGRTPRSVARAGPAAHFGHLAQLADGLALLLAFPLAYLAKTRLLPADLTNLYDPEVYIGPAALVALGTLAVLGRRGAYTGRDVLRVSRMFATVLIAVGQALVLAATAMFVFKLSHVSRLFVGLYGAAAVVVLIAVRVAFRRIAVRLREQGSGAARVLLIGEGEAAERVESVLSDEVPFGVAVVAQLPADALERSSLRASRAGSGDFSPVVDLLRDEAIDEVAVASGELSAEALEELIEACEREGVALHLALDALGRGLERATYSQHAGHAMLSLNPQLHSAWGRAVKRAIDLVAAPSLILLTAPLWLAAAIAIKLDSPGPVFFVQERIGLNKRRFKMLKFRSMLQGSEHLRPMLHPLNEADGPIFKLRQDPRVTRVGRWLRRFDLDELPQLLNVLRGDMSLIGPRPMLASEITGFEPWQRKRFSMLPGITGLWQVSNRLGQSFLDGLQADLDYIDRWSLRLDLEILLRTIPAVLRDRVAP